MDEFEDLFAQARSTAMRPSEALVQRVLADADRLQPRAAALVAARVPPAPRGLLAGLAGFFGGGLSLAGIGSAAVMGLFLGVVQPAGLASLAATLAGGETLESLDLMPGVDALLAEE